MSAVVMVGVVVGVGVMAGVVVVTGMAVELVSGLVGELVDGQWVNW